MQPVLVVRHLDQEQRMSRGGKFSGHALTTSRPRPQIDRDPYSHLNLIGKAKVSYFTREAALEAGDRVGREKRTPAPGAYRCRKCHLFHVGGTRKTPETA